MSDNQSRLVHGGEADRWGGWHWRKPSIRAEHWRTCSYCGSIHPDDLAAEIRSGRPPRAEWSDMKYGWPHKVYVRGITLHDPAKLRVFGFGNHASKRESLPDDAVLTKNLTRAQKRIVKECGYDPKAEDSYFVFAPIGDGWAKHYSVHLADPAVSAEVRDAIFAWQGLKISFTDDGRVSWSSGEVA